MDNRSNTAAAAPSCSVSGAPRARRSNQSDGDDGGALIHDGDSQVQQQQEHNIFGGSFSVPFAFFHGIVLVCIER